MEKKSPIPPPTNVVVANSGEKMDKIIEMVNDLKNS
jgi:hypothetical protein